MKDLSLLQDSWIRVGGNKPRYDYIASRVYQSAKDLVNKKLVPKYALMYFQQKIMLDQAISECFKSPFQEWTCPECMIRVYGPKKWIGFHLAIHGRFKEREGRGGEIFKMKFHLD